jgi:hypothetical protein
VQVVTDDATAAACRECGAISTSVRQRRTTTPRGLPYCEAPLLVRWHKIQYAWREPPVTGRRSPDRSPSCRPGLG